jgi:hypothetical protein
MTEIKTRSRPKDSFYDLFKDSNELVAETFSKSIKREDSISNTQTFNDSSFELSPNSSGILLLDYIDQLKKLLELQTKEIESVGQVIQTEKHPPEKLKEMLGSLNNGAESITTSIINQNSVLNFNDSPRHMISPVPPNFGNSDFASSLMSVSDYQLKVTEIGYSREIFLAFLRGRFRILSFMNKTLLNSHVPSLRI